jgi:hypothetical protein
VDTPRAAARDANGDATATLASKRTAAEVVNFMLAVR